MIHTIYPTAICPFTYKIWSEIGIIVRFSLDLNPSRTTHLQYLYTYCESCRFFEIFFYSSRTRATVVSWNNSNILDQCRMASTAMCVESATKAWWGRKAKKERAGKWKNWGNWTYFMTLISGSTTVNFMIFFTGYFLQDTVPSFLCLFSFYPLHFFTKIQYHSTFETYDTVFIVGWGYDNWKVNDWSLHVCLAIFCFGF